MSFFSQGPEQRPFVPRFLRGLRRFGLVMWLVPLMLWCAGRVLTDRVHITQYLFWMPTVGILVGGVLWFTLDLILAIATRRWRSSQPKPSARGRALLLAARVSVAAVAAYGVVEWKLWRSPPDGTPPNNSLRILFWNEAEHGRPDWQEPVVAARPDIAIIKPGTGRVFAGLLDRLRATPAASVRSGPDSPQATAPAPAAADAATPLDQSDFVYTNGFAVLTKFPVRRFSAMPLGVEEGIGIDPRRSDLRGRYRDRGNCLMLEIDTTARLGRTITIWLVDLPSDPSLHRQRVVEQAAETLRRGPKSVSRKVGPWGRYQREDVTSHPFPAPDLIIGDLNTPRGSASLDGLAAAAGTTLRHGYDEAGGGYAATFPRPFPLWHIDHLFAAPSMQVLGYRIVPTTGGGHRMQLADVAVIP